MEQVKLRMQTSTADCYKEAVERLLDKSAILVEETDSPNTSVVLTAPSFVEISMVCHLAGYIERDKWDRS